MRTLFRDLALAARLLIKAPGFTLAAVATLALGIGANTAMFTLADATLLRPLPFHDPQQLVVWSWSSAWPHYQEYAKRNDIFQGVLASGGVTRLNLGIDGSSELVQGAYLSGNAFDVLGVRPVAGRTLLPSDDVSGEPLVAVLNHGYWRSRFGGAASVVGRTLRVNGRPMTIVGVAEAGFRGITLGASPSLYLPAAAAGPLSTGFFSRIDRMTSTSFVWLTVVGRLRPDVTAAQASAAMDALYTQLQPPSPGSAREERLHLEALTSRALGSGAADVRTFVSLLLGVVGLTLLIGCANLANLLLAKAAARRREVGVRLALGATRARIVQHFLVESLLLAVLGGAAGLAVASFALQALAGFELPGGLRVAAIPLGLSGTALAVALFDNFDRVRAPAGLHHALHDGTFRNRYGFTGYSSGYSCRIRNLDVPIGDDVTFNRPCNDYCPGLEDSFPATIPGQGNRSVDIAVAVDFTTDHEVSGAGQGAGNFARLTDQRCRAAVPVA
jgi:predicted permease